MTQLLFLHGAEGSENKWRRVKSHLGHVPARFVDLEGHGENRDTIPTSIEAYADHWRQKITEDTIVVGHSMGGLIALELVARNEHIKGLVFVASHYRLPVHPKFLEQLANSYYPDKFFYAAYSKDADPQLLEEEKNEHEIFPIDHAFADFMACHQYDKGESTVSNLKIPILAVYGSEDRMIPPNACEKLVAANPAVETKTIDHAGHYVILEAPEAFTESVMEFYQFCEGGDHVE